MLFALVFIQPSAFMSFHNGPMGTSPTIQLLVPCDNDWQRSYMEITM